MNREDAGMTRKSGAVRLIDLLIFLLGSGVVSLLIAALVHPSNRLSVALISAVSCPFGALTWWAVFVWPQIRKMKRQRPHDADRSPKQEAEPPAGGDGKPAPQP